MSRHPAGQLCLCALTLLLAACGHSDPGAPSDPYANGADYPWSHTAPAGQLRPLNLTAGENALSSEPILSATNGWGPVELNRSNGEQGAGDGRTLTLNGAAFARGFGTHAGSELRFSLRGTGAACTRFTASVGVDDEVGERGSVQFQVYLDGAKAYDSGTMTGSSATKTVNVNVTGKGELRLVVTDAGNGKSYDHADWADPKIFCEASGASGRLDPGFDRDGIVQLPVNAPFDEARAFEEIALQSGGRVVAATLRGVYRYNADGSRDPSFGTSGVALPLGEPVNIFNVGVQPDQGVVFAGDVRASARGYVQRLLPNGAPDRNFGTNGVISVGEAVRELAVQPDGRFLTAGVTGTPPQLVVRRFLPGGLPDTSYGTGGRVQLVMGSLPEDACALVELLVQPDGKAVVGARFRPGAAGTFALDLTRLLPDGRLDPSFDGDGRLRSTPQGVPILLSDLALAPDGRLVAAGETDRVPQVGVVVRFEAGGRLDPTFGASGVTTFPNFIGADPVVVQSDGRVVLGLTPPEFVPDAVARLQADGRLDPSFGSAGIVRLPLAHTFLADALVQPDGRLLFSGGEIDRSADLLRLLP